MPDLVALVRARINGGSLATAATAAGVGAAALSSVAVNGDLGQTPEVLRRLRVWCGVRAGNGQNGHATHG